MKVEFHNRYLWPTEAAPKPAIGDWFERVYNRRRRNFAIGMISPVDWFVNDVSIKRIVGAAMVVANSTDDSPPTTTQSAVGQTNYR